MPSDSELLQRFTQEASQEAFSDLVRRHIDFVYATALRLAGSDARAQDVTQEVFTDLAKKASGLIGRSDLVGWLHTSTRYAAASLRRSEARREQREQKAHPMHDDLSSTNDQIDWDKLRPLLDDALHALGERDREAILLRYFKQRSLDEIGVTLGLTEEAARKRIERGVEKLRSHLAKRGVTSTLVALELAMATQAVVAAPAGLATTVATTSLAAAATQTTTFLAPLLAGLKIAVVVASVIAAIVSGGLVVNSANTCRNAETALANEKQRLSAQHKSQIQRSNRLTEIEQIRAAQQRALADLKATTAARINRINPKGSGEKFIDALLQLDLDAEMKEAMRAFWRCMLSSQYFHGPLLHSLRLSPEQIESFTKICIGDAPSAPGWKFTDAGNGHGSCSYSMKSNIETKTVDENAMRQLLGDAGFQAYQEHSKTMFIQMLIVNKLASNLVYTDAPLNADTAKRLTTILAKASADPENPIPTDIHWEKALKEAKTVLTPTQLSALARLSGTLSTSWSYEF